MTATQVPPEIRRGRNRLAAIVVLGHAIKHVYNSGLQTLLLPNIKIGLGLNAAQYGTLFSARQVTSWGTTLGAGYLGDRFSNRAGEMMGVSMGLIGVAFLVMGYAPGYLMMLVALLLAGMGPSLYHPPALGELSRRFPDRRGFAISLHGTGGNAGEVLGPWVTAGALALLVWRDVLRVSVFPAFLGGLLLWGMMRSVSRQADGATSAREYFTSLLALLKNPVLVFLVVATMLRSMGETAIDGFLPLYLTEDLEFSAPQVALYLSLAKVAGLVTQPVMGYLSDRQGRKAVLVPGMAAITVLSFALAFAGTGLRLALVIVAKGAFAFPLHHILIAAAIDATRGRVQSTVVALIYGAGFLGVFSPALAGLIVDSRGIHSAFIFGGSMGVVATLVVAFLRLPRTAQQAEAAARQGLSPTPQPPTPNP